MGEGAAPHSLEALAARCRHLQSAAWARYGHLARQHMRLPGQQPPAAEHMLVQLRHNAPAAAGWNLAAVGQLPGSRHCFAQAMLHAQAAGKAEARGRAAAADAHRARRQPPRWGEAARQLHVGSARRPARRAAFGAAALTQRTPCRLVLREGMPGVIGRRAAPAVLPAWQPWHSKRSNRTSLRHACCTGK